MRIYVYKFLDGTGTILLNEQGDRTVIYGEDVELVGFTEMSLVTTQQIGEPPVEKEALEG